MDVTNIKLFQLRMINIARTWFADDRIGSGDHIIEQGPERGLRRCLGRYFSRNSSCFVLSAPRRFDRMSSTASSYVMPSSIRANATITGALPKPATQWIATQVFGFERNCSFSRLNHWSRISGGGVWPSGNAASW